MAQVVKLKRSSVAGNVPTTGQMAAGELAMNTADGKLFLRDDSTVRPILTTDAEITGSINLTGDVSASAVSASTYYGDGSNLTGIETDPFPYTGSAVISGSLDVIGDITGSGIILMDNGQQGGVIKVSDSSVNNNSSVSIGNNSIIGTRLIAIGHINSTSYYDRVAIGARNVGGGNQSVVIGDSAASNNTSNSIIAIGQNTNRFCSGVGSVAIGTSAMYNNGPLGNAYTVAIGTNAGYTQSGTYNTLIGTSAGRSLNGEFNSILGPSSGYDATGDNNIILGNQTGYNASGSKNVILGYQAGYNLTGSNQLIIANNSSSALVTGDFANSTFNISGSVSASTYYGDGSNLTGISSDPFPYTGDADITGYLNVDGNITASGNISGSLTGSFKHLKATTIEGNSPLIIKGVSNLTFADPGDGITFSNTNLYGNPVFHGDVNIYNQSQFLDQSDNVIFESTNNGDPFNGEIQFGGFAIPTKIRGVGITLGSDTVISGSLEVTGSTNLNGTVNTTSNLIVGGQGKIHNYNFLIGTQVTASGFNSVFEFGAGSHSNYHSHLILRPRGNPSGYNNNYWGSIGWDPGGTLQGLQINTGNYKTNIWFTEGVPGTADPNTYGHWNQSGLKIGNTWLNSFGTATERLDVVGNIKASGFVTASGNIETQGELIGTINGGTF